jgi:DNA-binding response OmpR family regulator
MAGTLSAGQLSAYPPARLLLVDQEPRVCAALTRALETIGYCVEAATSAERALMMLESQPFDVMILDPSMPGINGPEVMSQVHRRHPEVVMIVLAREVSVEGAIAAVKCGASDYVVKPTGLRGLADAVIEVLQRQTEQIRRHATLRAVGEMIATLQQGEPLVATSEIVESRTPYSYHKGPVYLDCQHQLVVVEGEIRREHQLTRGETTILRVLMTRAGEAVSQQYLAAILAGDGDREQCTPDVVRSYVHRLRRKIESDPDSPRVIRTVRGEGYLFAVA